MYTYMYLIAQLVAPLKWMNIGLQRSARATCRRCHWVAAQPLSTSSAVSRPAGCRRRTPNTSFTSESPHVVAGRMSGRSDAHRLLVKKVPRLSIKLLKTTRGVRCWLVSASQRLSRPPNCDSLPEVDRGLGAANVLINLKDVWQPR